MTAEQKLIEAAEEYDWSGIGSKYHFINGAKSEAARAWHYQWLPMSVDFPEKHGKNVLAITNTGIIRITYIDRGRNEFDTIELMEEQNEHYIAWMPLPEPPKNKTREDYNDIANGRD